MKKIFFIIFSLCATLAMAQMQQFPGQPPQRESADVRALRKTQMLRDTLHLNSDQFNRVYKVYYNEYSAMEQSMSQGMGGGMPPQGMGGGGMPPQGMGGGGMPPMGMGGGMPPMGMGGDMPQMGGGMPTPPSQPKELSAEQLQKQQAKRQKKMKKILTEQQYELWFILDTQPPQRRPCPNPAGPIGDNH